jgi:predicted GNAT family acetyltransferase
MAQLCMDVALFKDAAQFADQAAPYMRSDLFSTNVIGVYTAGILDGSRHQTSDDLWAAVTDHDRVIGVAMHTPPYHVFLSRMGAPAASKLAEVLLEAEHPLPGVIGERTAVEAFVDTWAVRTGGSSTVDVSMRMYRLKDLKAPTGVSGIARTAGPKDAERVTKWFAEFHAEAMAHQSADDLELVARRRLAAGEISLWFDGGRAVSLAARSTPANGVARVGPVYTPPTARRHGYGAAVTAAVSQEALVAGATHVVLYTDLANPISNSIYQSIGYIPDHDAQDRGLQIPRREETTAPGIQSQPMPVA